MLRHASAVQGNIYRVQNVIKHFYHAKIAIIVFKPLFSTLLVGIYHVATLLFQARQHLSCVKHVKITISGCYHVKRE